MLRNSTIALICFVIGILLSHFILVPALKSLEKKDPNSCYPLSVREFYGPYVRRPVYKVVEMRWACFVDSNERKK